MGSGSRLRDKGAEWQERWDQTPVQEPSAQGHRGDLGVQATCSHAQVSHDRR